MGNKSKIFLLFCIPFLVSSYSEPSASEALFGPKSYPGISSCWVLVPEVKVCANSRVTEARVGRAISYWEKLGYEFSEVIYNDSSISCAGAPGFGEIIIDIPGQNFDNSKLATTSLTSNRAVGIVIHAEIQIPDANTTKERVLEHELGHALGWGHTNRSYHIMHENWARGGHDATGIDRRRYSEVLEGLCR